MLRAVFRIGLALSLALVLIALTLWSAPALAQGVVEAVDPSTLAGVGAGGSLLNLLGLAATAGRGWQKLADHGTRLEKVEKVAVDVPAALARLETMAKAHGEKLDGVKADFEKQIAEVKSDLHGRCDRIEDRLDR